MQVLNWKVSVYMFHTFIFRCPQSSMLSFYINSILWQLYTYSFPRPYLYICTWSIFSLNTNHAHVCDCVVFAWEETRELGENPKPWQTCWRHDHLTYIHWLLNPGSRGKRCKILSLRQSDSSNCLKDCNSYSWMYYYKDKTHCLTLLCVLYVVLLSSLLWVQRC